MTSSVKPAKFKFIVIIWSKSNGKNHVDYCNTMADVVRLTYGLKTNWEVRVDTKIVLTDDNFGDWCQDGNYTKKYKHAIRSMKAKGYIK